MADALPLVKQTISAIASGGVGDLTLGGPVPPYFSFLAGGAMDGHSYTYTIVEGTKLEAGVGRYVQSSNTFQRTKVLMSTASGGVTSPETFSTAAVITCSPQPWDVIRPQVEDYGNSGSGTKTFEWGKSQVWKITNSAAHTWALAGWPPAGYYGEMTVWCANAGAFAITFPTIQWIVGDGTTTTTFANLGVTLQASGMNQFIFWTIDGGTTVYGKAV